MIGTHKKLFLLGFMTLFLLYSVADDVKIHAQQESAETYKSLKKFGTIFEHIRREFVEEVSDEELLNAAIHGMFTVLDPHSSYLNEKSYERLKVNTQGFFGGLGIEVTKQDSYILIVAPFDDTPAFRAGLRAGDQIIAINGEDIAHLSLLDAVHKMRGREGTDITLTIRRDRKPDNENEPETFTVTLTREIINIPSVRHRIEKNDIGYIRITKFSGNTDKQLQKAIEQIKSERKLIGVVLDLRNNPGGLLQQALLVSDMFLEQGEIVSIRSRQEGHSRRYNATQGDVLDGLPLVVLVNKGSASASEIVTGALQDHKRALILGTKSFGKGSVQTVTPLQDSNTAIRLTTALYYTPSGRSIQQQGVIPDIEQESIPSEEDLDSQLSHALDLIHGLHLFQYLRDQR